MLAIGIAAVALALIVIVISEVLLGLLKEGQRAVAPVPVEVTRRLER